MGLHERERERERERGERERVFSFFLLSALPLFSDHLSFVRFRREQSGSESYEESDGEAQMKLRERPKNSKQRRQKKKPPKFSKPKAPIACGACLEIKPASDFSKNQTRRAISRCRDCIEWSMPIRGPFRSSHKILPCGLVVSAVYDGLLYDATIQRYSKIHAEYEVKFHVDGTMCFLPMKSITPKAIQALGSSLGGHPGQVRRLLRSSVISPESDFHGRFSHLSNNNK